MNNLLLGFDCRLVFSDKARSAWDRQRRELYLLKTDIDLPISVDTAVSPSIFDFDTVDVDAEKIHLQPSDFHQQALRLWRDLASMQHTLPHDEGLRSTMTIAIQLHHENLDADDWWRDFAAETVTPADLGSDWLSIGFDVADRYLTSALSNCGYDQEIKKQTGANLGSDINEWGLISKIGRADAFRVDSDSRVQEHAPFFVFEIFQFKGQA